MWVTHTNWWTNRRWEVKEKHLKLTESVVTLLLSRSLLGTHADQLINAVCHRAIERETEREALEFARKGRNSVRDLRGTIHPRVLPHTISLWCSAREWWEFLDREHSKAISCCCFIPSSSTPHTHIREQQRYKQVCFCRCPLHNCAHSNSNV